MKNLKAMNDDQLVLATRDAIKNERASTTEVVRHFQEIVDRKIFLKLGYPSMFEMVTKLYGYCNGSAQRRINSMRLVKDLPEVVSKLESGELSLTAAATVQSFFYAEKKDNKNYSKAQKLEVVDACSRLSVNEVHRELAKRNPQLAKKEFKRAIDEEKIRISFNITIKLDKKIEHLKSLMSHTNPNMKMEELLERLVELGLDKLDPVRKAKRSALKKAKQSAVETPASVTASPRPRAENQRRSPSGTGETEKPNVPGEPLPSAEVKRTRYISAQVRHEVWSSYNGGGCEFIAPNPIADAKTVALVDSTADSSFNSRADRTVDTTSDSSADSATDSTLRCGSQTFLQLDHQMPFSAGGAHETANLRILCSAHNRHVWDRWPRG